MEKSRPPPPIRLDYREVARRACMICVIIPTRHGRRTYRAHDDPLLTDRSGKKRRRPIVRVVVEQFLLSLRNHGGANE